MEHTRVNNIFSKQQFGFIKGRSTVLQLLNVMDSWTMALDNGFSIDSIYLDFMKAFDTVPHKRLIYKLRMNGIIKPLHFEMDRRLLLKKYRGEQLNSFQD